MTTEHWYEEKGKYLDADNIEERVPDAGIRYNFTTAYEIIFLPYTSRATSIEVVESGRILNKVNISEYNKCNNVCEAQEQCTKDCSINLCTEKQKEFLEIPVLLNSQNVHINSDEEGFLVIEEKNGLFVETKI